MFCTQCGNELRAGDKFCGQCGTPVIASGASASDDKASAPSSGPPPLPGGAGDWRASVDYRLVLNHPEVTALIARAEGSYEKGMSADQFLAASAPILKLAGAGAVPIRTIAEIAPQWYGRMGVNTGKTGTRDFALPVGRTIAAVACAFAARNLALIAGEQATDGCALKAKIGSSVWTFGGELTVTLKQAGGITHVEAATVIPGQMFDWGASKRQIADLFTDIERFSSLQP